MKKLISMFVLVLFLASCENPLFNNEAALLPDEVYDARLEGTWTATFPVEFKTMTFQRVYGKFIGVTLADETVIGDWNAYLGMYPSGDGLCINYDDEMQTYVYTVGTDLMYGDEIVLSLNGNIFRR